MTTIKHRQLLYPLNYKGMTKKNLFKQKNNEDLEQHGNTNSDLNAL